MYVKNHHLLGNSYARTGDTPVDDAASIRANASAVLCDRGAASVRANSLAALRVRGAAAIRANTSALRGRGAAVFPAKASGTLRGRGAAAFHVIASAALRGNGGAATIGADASPTPCVFREAATFRDSVTPVAAAFVPSR